MTVAGGGGGPGRTFGGLLLTFGSAVTSADVPAYLRSVRGGADPSEALIAEFSRRFDVIGRSPLLDITAAQAEALERTLGERHGAGAVRVAAGMLHSAPRVADSLARLVEAGAGCVIAVVLAPQYSPLILSGYRRALDEAAPRVAAGVSVRVAGAWHLVASWIDSWMMASTLTGTVSRVSACSALKAVVWIRPSITATTLSRTGMMANIPAPLTL